MGKEMIKKMLAKAEARLEAVFEKMLETSSDEDTRAYENLVDNIKDLKAQLAEAEALEEKETLAKGGTIPEGAASGLDVKGGNVDRQNEAAGRRGNFSEAAVMFGMNFVEAVAKGTTFNGLLPRDVAQQIQMKKEEICRIRGLCSVHTASGEYTVYFDGDEATVDYVGEATAFGETSPSANAIGLAALKLGGLIKVSKEYLTDLGVDVLTYLVNKISRAMAKKEDHEILFGVGTSSSKSKIRGICSNTSIGTVTAAATTTVTWEDVKQTIQKIGAYRNNATIVCSQAFLDICHSFKDGNTYMFPQNQQIQSILGVPVRVSGEFETIAAGKVVMVVGDFSYYHILEREGMEVTTLNELYAATGQIGILAVERIDGDLTIAGAFACLKTKAS